jgi:hypothetical protein
MDAVNDADDDNDDETRSSPRRFIRERLHIEELVESSPVTPSSSSISIFRSVQRIADHYLGITSCGILFITNRKYTPPPPLLVRTPYLQQHIHSIPNYSFSISTTRTSID